MPAGPLPPNPAELLMSEKLKNLLAELAKRYDRVIIDSPPINPVTDAVVLAKLVDGTVMVCRSEQTTLDDMRSARRTLADVKAHVLGAVLNGVDFTRFEYKYSYYYGHYGRYGSYGRAESDAESLALITLLLVFGFAAAMFLVPRYVEGGDQARKTGTLLFGAYALRLIIMAAGTYGDLPIIGGGDAETYEWWAWAVARRWMMRDDLEFIDDGSSAIRSATLPINTFALVFYANGEPSRLAGTALIAGLGCLTVYNLYTLANEFGADPRQSYRALALQLVIPGYLVYTSNMFKDGIAAFLVITAFGAGMRLSRRLSLVQAGIAGVSMLALYYTRFYMVVMTGLPLITGLVMAKHGGFLRRFVVPAVLLVAVGVVGSTKLAEEITAQMEWAYDHATQSDVTAWNAGTAVGSTQGSGVTFDDGGDAFGALGPKVAYTLFSPFPWTSGSVALQVGKIDALIWYYLFYRMALAAKRLWSEDRGLLAIFASFLIPSTIAYATTMANIGLIVRQRIPIVMVGTLLAMMSWPRRDPQPVAAPVEPAPPEPDAPVAVASPAELFGSSRGVCATAASPPIARATIRARKARPYRPDRGRSGHGADGSSARGRSDRRRRDGLRRSRPSTRRPRAPRARAAATRTTSTCPAPRRRG
jgi:hypothetical protein